MVLHSPSYINNHLKVKYPFSIFAYAQAKQIKNYMKSISVTKVATTKIQMDPRAPVTGTAQCLKSKVFILFLSQLFFNSLHSNTNQDLKSTSVIKVAIMKNTEDFHYTKEAIMCNQQIDTFHCQQR